LGGFGLRGLIIAGVAMALNMSPAVFAQIRADSQSVPSQLNPGLLTPSTVAPDQSRTEKRKQLSPLDEVQLDLPEIKQALPQPQSPPFLVRQIRVQGVTLLTPEEMKDLAAPYVGREETLEQLGKLVESITEAYRKRGYLTTEAYIPPQDIQNGEMTIGVQEGYVGQISIEGSRFYNPRLIRRSIRLKPSKLLNFRTLERDLNQLNRFNDGFKVKAFLSAGDQPGQTHIRIRVAEKQPFQVSGTYDNQGRPFIGWYRGGVEFRDDSLTTLGDRLYGRWIGAQGTQVAMGSYTLPLNRFGTELSTSFAYSRVHVMLPVEQPPLIIGKAYNTTVTLSQPLGRERRWTADVGLNFQQVSSYFDGDKTSYVDIRALQHGLTYSRYDRLGRTYARAQNTFAFHMGGNNSTVSFWKVEGLFNRLVTLPKGNLLILKAYTQMTPDALPASEQFQIGGENTVRGYTEGLLIGDRGVNLGVEDRFPIPGLKKISPWLGSRIQGVIFYDFGKVWLDHSNVNFVSGVSDTSQRTFLQSVGFGCRAQLTRFLQGFIDVGFGLNNRKDVEPERRQPTARVHFGIRTDLLPENYRMRSQNVTTFYPYYRNHPSHVSLIRR